MYVTENWVASVTVMAMFAFLFSSEMKISHQQAEAVLVPLYTLLVVLYLSLVGFRKHLEPFLPAQFRSKSKCEPVAIPPAPPLVVVTGDDQPVNVTGAYKLVSNDNFEKFLEVQGVPWALRRAANAARPTHRLTHVGNQLTIKVEGIIESQTTYTINGPPIETNVRGRIFQDQLTYLDGDKKGIAVRKKALSENYDVSVERELLENGNITMTSVATFSDGRPPVQCVQQFKRI